MKRRLLPVLASLSTLFALSAQDDPGGMAPPKPGPEQQRLQPLVGRWAFEVTNFLTGGEPMKMSGIEVIKPVCNGIWLRSDVYGTDQPFSGALLLGWDAFENAYVSVWIDSWSPFPNREVGQYDAETKAFEMLGEMAMPGMPMKTRTVITFGDDGAREHKVWMTGPDGKEMLGMHLVTKRAQGELPAPKEGDASMGAPREKAHDELGQYVGKWHAVMTMEMPGAPAADPVEMLQVDSYVCDKRWVETLATGDFMGMPFEGRGLTGYDSTKQQFVSFWIDNMTPHMMHSRGTFDAARKVLTLHGDTFDMTGRPVHSTDKTTFLDTDHRRMEMTSVTKKGSESAGKMTIEYSRKS